MRTLSLILATSFFIACGMKVQEPPFDAGSPPPDQEHDGGFEHDAGLDQTDAGSGPDAGRDPERLDALVDPIREEAGLPALAAAAFDSAGVLGIGASGIRKFGEPTEVTTDDKWHLGSCTKAMTSTLVALLIEDGLLEWSTTLGEAFDADWVPALHASYRDITVTQLLGHIGGAPADIPAELWNALWQPGEVTAQRKAFVEDLLTRPAGATPGTFVYSNAGYMVVGAYLEKLTGKSWETLMEERIFQPLGMESCGFGPQATPGTTDQPWGHTRASGTWVPQHMDNPKALGPAGTVHCSLEDWGRYLREHLRGLRGEETTLPLSSTAWSRLHTPLAGGSYALGWGSGQRTWAGGAVYTHTGSNTMNYAVVWLAPNVDRAFVAVSNAPQENAFAPADKAVAELISRFP